MKIAVAREVRLGRDDQVAAGRAAAQQVEQGTTPNDELYDALVPGSSNLGAVDHDALLGPRAQDITTNAEGSYQLFRIGHAVSSRNIHAAIYDAFRLCLAV